MKKRYLYIWFILVLMALASCTKDTAEGVTPDTPKGKTLIALSQEGSAMRAGFTRSGFENTTKVVVRIQAVDGSNTSSVRYAQAVMTAGAEVTNNDEHNAFDPNLGAHSHMSYVSGQERYWDDAYGRTSRLSVYGVAIPNNQTELSDNILNQTPASSISAGWYAISGAENTKISWSIGSEQDATTHSTKDIAYSNNIRETETTYKGRYVETYNSNDTWTKSMELGYLRWEPKTSNPGETTGYFDQGHLVFKHALTWLTIKLTEGEGFDHTSSADFQWTNGTATPAQNLTLRGFPISGTLDISNGSWTDATTADITKMYEATASSLAANTTRTLHAYVLPGTNIGNVTGNMLSFEIDRVSYNVTGTQIAAALPAGFTATEAGKHYTINITIGKTKVDNLTASIVDWENVNSTTIEPKNNQFSFAFEDRGNKYDSDDEDKFGIYYANSTQADIISESYNPDYNWTTGYNGPVSKTFDTDHWTTNWSWPDNKTFTHFRVAGKGESTVDNPITITTDATGGDNFAISSGAGKDYVWGAPFVDVESSVKFKYDNNTKGFAFKEDGTTYQIHKGLPASSSQINMLLFHMLSQIKVNVSTSTGEDAVTLQKNDGTADADKTKVEVINILPTGKVLMGTGLVSATGTRGPTAMGNHVYTPKDGTTTPASVQLTLGVVPQPLAYDGGKIGLRITTPDGNQYIISDLSTVKAESVSENNLQNPYTQSDGKYTIGAWYPNYEYTYNVKIVKTGVKNITAAVVPWETVSPSDLGTITLEN